MPKPSPEPMPFQRGQRGPMTLPPFHWISPAWSARLEQEGTTAHRLASSPLAWLERFGSDLLLSYKAERAREALLAAWAERVPSFPFPVKRIFGKYLARAAEERLAPVLLQGNELGLETEVTEAGVRYGLDFAAGYSAGLFIDQRANRARVRAGEPRRILNTFAYTCSFSVVAALAGAETLSLDLSRKSLNRGKENFLRNGLDPENGHRFLADDVLEVLPRLAKRKETFDLIVLDPPTFSRNKQGKAFQVERDFGSLLAQALELAAPGGQILLSSNCTTLRVADLEKLARLTLKAQGRSGSLSSAEPLPDIPEEQAPRTVWLELVSS